ncbi:ABC transporter permease subunit [Paracoccus aminovorans]|uniref:ABC transporter permease subunit n=1 Tax=Paracoccus aminovorans TaxID=34004 RepID=UPI002B2639F7|nr:ABC transporter permease subunit [Paracoccus aminovorans]
MSETRTQAAVYVRETMLPPAPPPVTQRGAIKWLRENLFSGPLNILLTLLGLGVLWLLIGTFGPWLAHSVWNADSMVDCRRIVAETWGQGAHGACFAVVKHRWNQFLFGFYPPVLYWRPVLAFGLLFLALAPVLFSDGTRARRVVLALATVLTFVIAMVLGAPTTVLLAIAVLMLAWTLLIETRTSRALLASLIYPLLAVWLLWGGSLWSEISIVVFAVLSLLLWRFLNRPLDGMLGAALGLIVGLATAIVVYTVFTQISGILFGLFEMGQRWAVNGGAILKAFGWGLTIISWPLAYLTLGLGWIAPFGWIIGATLMGRKSTASLGLIAAVALFVGLLVFLLWPLVGQLEGVLSLASARVSSNLFGGFVLSIAIGVAGIALSLPLGIILALARRSDLPVIKILAVMFIEFIRGVPLITLLFVASLLLNYFLPPGTNFDIILRVIIMVTLFASAYMAEVIRGGLAALPRGQYEAADALGLDYWKAQRLIVLPQALKISIPGIVSTFIGLFKDTTLVVFVGLFDPLKGMTDTIRANFEWKGAYWEPYIFVGAIFFILCFGMSRYSMYLERRLKRDNR